MGSHRSFSIFWKMPTNSKWHDPFSDSEDDGLITWEYVGTVLPKYTANVQ